MLVAPATWYPHAAAALMTPVSCACSELVEDDASAVSRVGTDTFAIDASVATIALRQAHTEATVRERFPPTGVRLLVGPWGIEHIIHHSVLPGTGLA